MAHIDWIGTVLFPLVAIYSNVPLLGWAKPVPVNWQNLKSPRRDFALVAAAGPISNLILATIGAAVLGLGSGMLSYRVFDLVSRFVLLNALLAVFNMIPVPPLDGGNVAAGLLPLPLARLVDQIRPYGFLILYALLFTGVLGKYVFPIALTIVRFLVSVF
jgi:Zn-dependent protease